MILQITVYYIPSYITLAFANLIKSLVNGKKGKGSYNHLPFLGAATGEVQLMGASGGGIVVDVIPITFDFSLKNNIINQPDPGFPNVTALGHDVIDYWFFHEFDNNNSKKIVMAPEFRYVHRLASPENYKLLKIPGHF